MSTLAALEILQFLRYLMAGHMSCSYRLEMLKSRLLGDAETAAVGSWKMVDVGCVDLGTYFLSRLSSVVLIKHSTGLSIYTFQGSHCRS